MDYVSVHFEPSVVEEFVTDLLAHMLAKIGFESFDNDENGMNAYISEEVFSEEKIRDVLAEFPLNVGFEYTIKKIKRQNWNEEWERNFFEPIIVADRCIIHSSFHKDVPSLPIDIVIDPKMSFGTGHHQTTRLMLETIFDVDVKGKSVLDMGCGTSVLAILASKLGAGTLTSVDIDDWCVENSIENLRLNNVENVAVYQGDAQLLKDKQYDIIFANINRNILLEDIPIYSSCLSEGWLLLSGFYEEDVPLLTEKANVFGLTLEGKKQQDNWVCLLFRKS